MVLTEQVLKIFAAIQPIHPEMSPEQLLHESYRIYSQMKEAYDKLPEPHVEMECPHCQELFKAIIKGE